MKRLRHRWFAAGLLLAGWVFFVGFSSLAHAQEAPASAPAAAPAPAPKPDPWLPLRRFVGTWPGTTQG